MIKVPVLDIEKKEKGALELNPDVFGVEVKPSLIHRVLKWQMTVIPTGTASSKTRGEVSGGGKKPWKQKGTGRARAGSIRSPLWRHGGVTFGPRPRLIRDLLPVKVRKLAIKMLLSDLVNNKAIIVLDDDQKMPLKTKQAGAVLKVLGVGGRVLVIASPEDHDTRGLKNLVGVEIITRPTALRFDRYVRCEKIITFPKALKEVEAQLLK